MTKKTKKTIMKALILAAGYATRLYPLTKEYPKPLLLVKERPIIDYIIDKLKSLNEIDEIIVVTNSKFISKFKEWAAGIKIGKPIFVVDDLTKDLSDRRGAVGDMDFVITNKKLKDDLLVIGGDNLLGDGLQGFLDFSKSHKDSPAIGVYDINDLSLAHKYGVVKLNRGKRIIDFKEKPKNPKSTLVAMCLYYFPKSKIDLSRQYLLAEGAKHDATGFYIDWLRKKEAVFGFVFQGRWYDIGDHHFYNEAKEKFNHKEDMQYA
jgi:glucose-1-phosphate thymidylyltransferase